jgi:CBS-domain-containing membrane protein
MSKRRSTKASTGEKTVKTVVTDTSTVSALLKIDNQEAFPVVNEETNEYMGYISKETIRRADPGLTDLSCGQFLAKTDVAGLTRSVYVLHEEPAIDAVKKLAKYNIDVLPILDQDGKYDGIVDYPSLALIIAKNKEND